MKSKKTKDVSLSSFDFDVVVIGSGFGGSVAALRLTQKGYRVAVVEKGKRWNPEDFPPSNWRLRRSFWAPPLACHGIWALHQLRDVLVLHGVGVGGGSLLYACTLFEPPEVVWDNPQWKGLADWRAVMPEHFKVANTMLGTTTNPRFGPADEALRKAAQRRGREHTFRPTPVSIFFGEPDVVAKDPYFAGEGPDRVGCTFCGGCMVGCRVGAKNTLDRNYLFLAERAGATIIPETKVEEIQALDTGGYRLLWRRSTEQVFPTRGALTAPKVVLAAGVLGTVPLLMISLERGSLRRALPRLGEIVRTNSEALLGVTVPGRRDLSQGVAITSKVEMDEVTHMEPVRFPKGSDVVLLLGTMLTDGGPGVPRQLRWLGTLLRHPLLSLKLHKPWGKAESSLVLMAMQTLDNQTRLVRRRQFMWPFTKTLTSQPQTGHAAIASYNPLANQVAREVASELGGIPSSSLNEVILDTSTTAHILGGCAMAQGPDRGVVDAAGRVFGYDGLYVMDASIIGANLGVNPSLTITALAEYLCSQMPAKGA